MALNLAQKAIGGTEMTQQSFEAFRITALAVDPIHVGTGGARLGRVDLTIVRDPVTRVPKIPGSSLAGVYRAYAAMAEGKYPDCAGQGQPEKQGRGGHCGQSSCRICRVFGSARRQGGGFAGLAAFSDAQVLLFPVATREGPVWVTCPGAMRLVDTTLPDVQDHIILRPQAGSALNLGWLMLQVQAYSGSQDPSSSLNGRGIPEYIRQRWAVVSDKLFSHIVNSNLEVRTSVSINPETGAAEEGALFTYEALPRATVLVWEIICKNPVHFRVEEESLARKGPSGVYEVAKQAHPYLEQLGIGGMGTRGMGRLRVISSLPLGVQTDDTQQQAGGK
jgi:CRISPR-associated protein Cmr4